MDSQEHQHKGPLVAGACVALGLAVLALALFALPRRDTDAAPSPPRQPVAGAGAAEPDRKRPAKGNAKSPKRKAIARAAGAERAESQLEAARRAWERMFAQNEIAHVPAGWVAGYYDLYAIAQRTFGVNWLLLASVHRQETAFSTAGSTYRGLNFARCCAGPMQFNVKNGPTTTWEQYRDAHRRAERPKDYPHQTERHPSVYDDFDAMMAAASLLRSSGAAAALDRSAWQAAYSYYGHDKVGVEYADQVVARAIGWSQNGFSINQGVDPKLIEAVHLAWGAPVLRQYEAADEKARKRAAAKRDKQRSKAGEGDKTEEPAKTTDEQTSTTSTTASGATTASASGAHTARIPIPASPQADRI